MRAATRRARRLVAWLVLAIGIATPAVSLAAPRTCCEGMDPGSAAPAPCHSIVSAPCCEEAGAPASLLDSAPPPAAAAAWVAAAPAAPRCEAPRAVSPAAARARPPSTTVLRL